jgi:hypothetical protein
MSELETVAVPPGAAAVPRSIRLRQWARWLFKKTVWNFLSTLIDRAGLTLQTVQVLVIDRRAGKVLLLATRESETGYFPVQGLRQRLGLRRHLKDPREDARRELAEEAVPEPLPLERFEFLDRYREGPNGQFDCRVFLVEADSVGLRLRGENSEGRPMWMGWEAAKGVVNGYLVGVLERLQEAG